MEERRDSDAGSAEAMDGSYNVDHGVYSPTDKFKKLYAVSTSEGTWRLDQNFFKPFSEAEKDWKPYIESKLLLRARIDNLLIKPGKERIIEITGNSKQGYHYELDFYPARYSNPGKDIHHIVFDFAVSEPSSYFVNQARVYEAKRKWELGAYYRKLATSHATLFENYEQVATDIRHVIETDRGAPLGRMISLSETHRSIIPPYVSKLATPQAGMEGVYVNPDSKTLVYGKVFFSEKRLKTSTVPSSEQLPQRLYFEELMSSLKSTGKRFTSVTFKALPALAVTLAVDNVARSEDKIKAIIDESTLFAGGVTGAALGGLYGTPLGPAGILAGGLLGGWGGTEATDVLLQYQDDALEWLEEKVDQAKDLWNVDLFSSKAEAIEPTSPKFNLNSANFNSHQNTEVSTLNVDEFLEHHTLPLFKNNPTAQKQMQYELLSQSILDSLSNAWYSGPSNLWDSDAGSVEAMDGRFRKSAVYDRAKYSIYIDIAIKSVIIG